MSSISPGGVSNIQQAAVLASPQPGSSIDKMTARLKAIANDPATLETLKDAGISMIPVYGTYCEFQKGNIGWGIFGAVTDIATLVGVGLAAKGVACSIRGGAAAVKVARVGFATSQTVNATTKVATMNLGKSLLRAVDPGVELLYKGGKAIVTGKALSSGKAVATVIVNGKIFKNWKILKTPVNDDWAVKKFIKLNMQTPKSLDSAFIKDLGRAEYIVNGNIIPRVMDARGNIDKLAMVSEFERRISNELQRQLVSVYANQEIFADVVMATHNAEYAAINSGTVTYNINKLSDGTIKLIAESQQDFRSLDELLGKLHTGKKEYSQLLRAEVTIPVPDKGAPTVHYCYSKT